MTRVLPFPAVSLGLAAMWLLLAQSLSPWSLLGAVLSALIGGWLLALLEPGRVHVRRLDLVLRLCVLVLEDIVRSNIAVTRIILGLRKGGARSGFVHVPLELRNPNGLAVLGCIVTATPGTAWTEYDSLRSSMLLHVLDLDEQEDWARYIKERYERPLMEIFV